MSRIKLLIALAGIASLGACASITFPDGTRAFTLLKKVSVDATIPTSGTRPTTLHYSSGTDPIYVTTPWGQVAPAGTR